jgi:hypothetical protein
MNKKILIALGFSAFFAGELMPTEFRAPLATERGPLRYDMVQKKKKWSLDTWAISHYRSANKAFLKHGTDTKELPALIFGKSEFTLGEAFEDAEPNKYYTEHRNPFLKITSFKPLVSYTEWGMTLGGRFEYPCFGDKNRVGAKISVPFKTVRMERDSDGENRLSGLNDSVIRGDSVLIEATNKERDGREKKVFSDITRYKLELLWELLRLNNQGQVISALELGNGQGEFPGNPNKYSGIMGRQYGKKILHVLSYDGIEAPFVVTSEIEIPHNSPVGVTSNRYGLFMPADAKNRVKFGFDLDNQPSLLSPSRLRPFPTTEANFIMGKNAGCAFASNLDYTNLPNLPGFKKCWAHPVYVGDTAQLTNVSRAAIEQIDELLGAHSMKAEEWLKEYGNFEFATNQRTGLGDIGLDFFWEHSFNEDWRGEVIAGIKFPTGGSSKYTYNPYRVQLGNGNHFELKLGADLGWATPLDWMNLKADASYNFALKAKEKRIASFKGAEIKNIGPNVDADVKWGYFLGHLDATLYHPKTDVLSSTFGYEFYYKTKDNINFKNKKIANHWLGKAWGAVTSIKAEAEAESEAEAEERLLMAAGQIARPRTDDRGNGWVPYEMELENAVAEKNTERIAHRFRFETNWRARKHLNIIFGGVYTFAGQNIPRETDWHCGVEVKF